MNSFMTSLGLCNMVKRFYPTVRHSNMMRIIKKCFSEYNCAPNEARSNLSTVPTSTVAAMPSGAATMIFAQDALFVECNLESNDDYVHTAEYVDSTNVNRPMYLLTQTQAIELASHYKRFHRELIRNIIAERDKLIEQNNRLLQERTQLLEQQNVLLLEDKTKYENLVNTSGTYTATEVGLDVGMNVHKFNEFLAEKKIQRREGNKWVLNPSYADKGYGLNRVAQITHSNGEKETVSYLVWTNKGRDFIINELCK